MTDPQRASAEPRRDPRAEPVRVWLLGGFRVSVGPRSIGEEQWRLRKAGSLIKLLALAPGHRLHREQAMDLLWPELDPQAATNNLHHALHVARRVLGPAAPASAASGYLHLRGERLALCPSGPLWVDVEAFEEAAATARHAHEPAVYQAAIELYSGELLPQERYEAWAGTFPPTRSPPAVGTQPEEPAGSGRHNLPLARTSFVGREREMLEVKRLLAMTRLLNLTGAGGSGKTRLALKVASDLAGAYADGVWLVELAPLSEEELVPQAIARALSVHEQPGRPLVETLVDSLRSRRMLLVLDNCEHLMEGVVDLVDALLVSCAGLRVLATSRETLNAAGEVRWVVPSLTVPDSGQASTAEELEGYESVRLFIERARQRDPSFVLTLRNAPAVAQVCRRLEGLPLAIELAAARMGALAVEQLARRLLL